MLYGKAKRKSFVRRSYLKCVLCLCSTLGIHLSLYILVLQVNFVGEGSIDTGGPRREFFRLLADRAQNSLYFHSGNTGGSFFCIEHIWLQGINS